MPHTFSGICRATLTPQTNRILQLGVPVAAAEAYQLGVITGLYTDTTDAESKIADFAKKCANQGAHKDAMRLLKKRMFKEFIETAERKSHGPFDILGVQSAKL